jgi:hypothetical protein
MRLLFSSLFSTPSSADSLVFLSVLILRFFISLACVLRRCCLSTLLQLSTPAEGEDSSEFDLIKVMVTGLSLTHCLSLLRTRTHTQKHTHNTHAHLYTTHTHNTHTHTHTHTLSLSLVESLDFVLLWDL